MIETGIDRFFKGSRTRTVLLWTFIFSAAAHLFRWVNMGFNGDSLMVFQGDEVWQTSLGRFMTLVYLWLRGRITAPLLIGLLATSYLTLSNIIIARVLDIKKVPSLVALCGITSTYSALTDSYATYLPWVDIYMLSLLLAVLAVYLAVTFRRGWIPAIVLLAVSMGLYPSYVQVATSLFVLWLIKMSVETDHPSPVIKSGLKAAAILVAGGLLYLICLKTVYFFTGITPSRTYNSSFNIGFLSLLSFPRLIYGAYKHVLFFFLLPETFFPLFTGACNLCLAVLAVPLIIRKTRQSRNWWITLVLLVLLPLSVNYVYVLSNASVRSWMVFSFTMLYVAILLFVEMDRSPERRIVKTTSHVLVFLVVFSAILYSNQMYLKKNLDEQATLSYMTRVIDRIEMTEGYEPGVTPVAFVGKINKSPIRPQRGWQKSVMDYAKESSSVFDGFSIVYYGSLSSYFGIVLGYPINMVLLNRQQEIIALPEVVQMPVFPDKGSCKIIDGILVVKFSDDLADYELPSWIPDTSE